MKRLCVAILLSLLIFGCDEFSSAPHYCRVEAHGLTLTGNYGSRTGCSREFSGYHFRAYGGVLKNQNEYAVKLKRWRQYYRQRDLVDVLDVPASSRINLQFTGGDRFEIIRPDTGELVGVLRPNVKYKDHKGNEVTYME